MKQKTVAVLFGGKSSEYEVSLQSAAAVIEHMDKARYTPVPVGITRTGEWFCFEGETEKIKCDTWYHRKDCTPVALSLEPETQGLFLFDGEARRTVKLDAVFPVLHGKNGEDGTVQGLVELAGIPLVGCGVLPSAICMNKDCAHTLVHTTGVAVPKSVVLFHAEGCVEATKMLSYPLFVKPVKAGSSHGITRITEAEELMAAVELAFRHDHEVIVEEAIEGFEVGCAVMGNETLMTGEIDEIELSGGFFDFSEKYTLKTSAIHVPARIPPEKAEEIKQAAKRIYKALHCRGFARVDLFLTPQGRLVFNEVNTIPGFTAHSRYPNMMKEAGIPFGEVVSRLIELAVE